MGPKVVVAKVASNSLPNFWLIRARLIYSMVNWHWFWHWFWHVLHQWHWINSEDPLASTPQHMASGRPGRRSRSTYNWTYDQYMSRVVQVYVLVFNRNSPQQIHRTSVTASLHHGSEHPAHFASAASRSFRKGTATSLAIPMGLVRNSGNNMEILVGETDDTPKGNPGPQQSCCSCAPQQQSPEKSSRLLSLVILRVWGKGHGFSSWNYPWICH